MANLDSKRRKILGVNFYVGDANGAIDRIARGGLLVVPAAPALKEISHNAAYREALLEADLAITDSAFMVLAWNLMERDSIRRLSGLEYLHELLKRDDIRKPGNTLWIMATPASADKNLAWLHEQGIEVPQECVYLAPMYGEPVEDVALLERINALQVRHVVVTIGGGTQERLGHYLKLNLNYLPAIHCIGAAIAFLSGDQVRIPMWADKLYLGWLLRCLASPRRFVPRYLSARDLLPMLWRFRGRLPIEG